MPEILLVLMRWLHIAGVALLIGGLWYGWFALRPDQDAMRQAWRRYGAVAVTAIVALIASGIFTILAFPRSSPRYHMVLGIKLLLALHVFAVAFLLGAGRTRHPKRAITGAAITGLVIIAISAYLRRIF